MGKQCKQCQTLFFWALKSLQMVTAAMKLKRRLLLGGKVMINLDSIFKSRDITLPTNVRLVKAMVFPVVMYGCENGILKDLKNKGKAILLITHDLAVVSEVCDRVYVMYLGRIVESATTKEMFSNPKHPY